MKSYIVFGAGNYGHLALEVLGKNNILFYVDNDKKKQGTKIFDIDIVSLEKALEIENNAHFVIAVGNEFYKELEEQLKQAGVDEYMSIQELQIEITKEKIKRRPDYIGVYKRAVDWIKNNTIEGEGIINNSLLRKSYPEVTGYYIPTLLRWGYKELAISYAKWLCSIQKEDGSWYDTENEQPYIFDSAQILKGLLAVRNVYPVQGEVDIAIKNGCNWILSNVTEEGQLRAPDERQWTKSYAFSELIHTYCLSPLVEAADVFSIANYKDMAIKILDYYKRNYLDDILNFKLLSHFYAYVIEAMIDMGEQEIAREAMENFSTYQRENGEVPAYENVDWVCSTGLFQIALIWFRLGELKKVNKTFEYACKLQNESGGWFGSYLSENNLKEEASYFPSAEISWAVKYFLDALYYRNLLQFECTAHIFNNEIEINDGRYKVVRNVLKNIKNTSNLKVLDVGCGKGRYLKKLVKEYPWNKYYAVDLSLRVMEYFSNIEVEQRQGSLTNIPYTDNSFDMVYTCEALEHAVDIERAVCEMARVTRTGGKIVVVDKNKSMYGYYNIDDWEQWFDEDELRNIMRKYCSDVEVEKKINFDDKPANGLFYAWIGTVG